MCKVKMIFQNLLVESRAHLQCKFELLDVNHQKFNKPMKYGNITLKFMKNGSWHPMWYTLGENCKGTIYNLIYASCFTKKVIHCARKMEINFFNQIFNLYVNFLITMVKPMLVQKMVMLSCNMP